MDQFLSRATHSTVVLLEVIALVWVGSKAMEIVSRLRFREELISKDNPAAGVTLAGFYLGLFLALSGLLSGPGGSLGHDSLLTAAHGAAAIVAIILSSFLWRPILQVRVKTDVIGARNLGAALVWASALVATGLIYRGALQGQSEHAGTVAAFFALGEGALLFFLILYEWVTPYDVYAEIGERGNLAAAVASTGATIAAGLIIGNAVEGDFTTWKESLSDALIYLIPLAGLPLVRLVVVNGLFLGFGSASREIIEDRNVAAGLIEGAAYVGIALFAVHLMP